LIPIGNTVLGVGRHSTGAIACRRAGADAAALFFLVYRPQVA